MDREGKQRVCMMVVHAGCFIGFDAILMEPFISELLFATVHGVIIQLCFAGRMSVRSRLFSPKQPHHGCAGAGGCAGAVPGPCRGRGLLRAGGALPPRGRSTKDSAAGARTALPGRAAGAARHLPVTQMPLLLLEQATRSKAFADHRR